MNVVTNSPLQVASIVWQSSQANPIITVVCKATFQLLPQLSPLAAVREEIYPNDQFWEQSNLKSLRRPSDLIPYKPWVDYFVVGHAYAPGGVPTHTLSARVGIGDHIKSIEVHSDRMWTSSAQLQRGAPFSTMPLRWERAAGGPGTINPVGMEHVFDARGLLMLPNFQMPNTPVQRPTDRIAPAGFGPIAPNWPSRSSKLGQLASVWNPWAYHRSPLPHSLDASFFNAAPPDQQLRHFIGNETILLENLHPEYPQLHTCLCRVIPTATLQRPGRPVQNIPLRCDTLCVDTDKGILSALFRGYTQLSQPDEAGVIIIHAEIEEMRDKRIPSVDPLNTTISSAQSPLGPKPILPFGAPLPGVVMPPAPPIKSPPPRPSISFSSDSDGHTVVHTSGQLSKNQGAEPLPFRAQATFSPPSVPVPPPPLAPMPEVPPPAEPMVPAVPSFHADFYPQADLYSENKLPPIPSEVAPPLPPPPEFIGLPLGGKDHLAEPGATSKEQPASAAAELIKSAIAEKRPLKTLELAGLDLSRIGFGGADLCDCDLSGCKLQGCDFAGTDLSRACLSDTDITGADFSRAKLNGANFRNSTGMNAKFDEAQLLKANFSGAEFHSGTFAKAQLEQATWEESKLFDCTFDKSTINGSSWDDATLRNCSFQHVSAEKASFSEVQWTGAKHAGANLNKAVFYACTFMGADFSEATLTASDFSFAKGEGLIFNGALMDKANLRLSALKKASFLGANLANAHADNADFTEAIFSKADLRGAAFREAILRGAEFSETRINEETDFRDADLTQHKARGSDLFRAKLQGAAQEERALGLAAENP